MTLEPRGAHRRRAVRDDPGRSASLWPDAATGAHDSLTSCASMPLQHMLAAGRGHGSGIRWHRRRAFELAFLLCEGWQSIKTASICSTLIALGTGASLSGAVAAVPAPDLSITFRCGRWRDRACARAYGHHRPTLVACWGRVMELLRQSNQLGAIRALLGFNSKTTRRPGRSGRQGDARSRFPGGRWLRVRPGEKIPRRWRRGGGT